MIRLPDPFTNPTEAPGFKKAPLIDNEPILQEALPSGKVLQLNNISAQYWSTTIQYPELYEAEYKLIMSAILEAKRQGTEIGVVLPQYVNHRVYGTFTEATIAADQKGSTVVITNADKIQGAPYVGDLFKLSTHPKVYKITKYARTGNTITLNVYPDLFITTTGSEKPVFNNIIFQMALVNRATMTEEVNTDGMYEGVQFTLRESL